MMQGKLIILLLLVLFIPSVLGVTYAENEDMFISHSVRIDGTPSSTIVCNVTVLDPDEITVVSYDAMINNATTQKHEYTVPNINKTGEWCYDLTCFGSTQNATSSFCKQVTPNGEEPSTASGIFYIGVFAVLVIFLIMTIWAITQFDNLIARFSLFQFAYILFIAIVFIAYMMATDFLTSAPAIISVFKIFFWVVTIGFFPYVLGMMIWLGYSMITIKEINQMMERGVPLDEAEARRKKKKW